jgi:hypothetical protein
MDMEGKMPMEDVRGFSRLPTATSADSSYVWSAFGAPYRRAAEVRQLHRALCRCPAPGPCQLKSVIGEVITDRRFTGRALHCPAATEVQAGAAASYHSGVVLRMPRLSC